MKRKSLWGEGSRAGFLFTPCIFRTRSLTFQTLHAVTHTPWWPLSISTFVVDRDNISTLRAKCKFAFRSIVVILLVYLLSFFHILQACVSWYTLSMATLTLTLMFNISRLEITCLIVLRKKGFTILSINLTRFCSKLVKWALYWYGKALFANRIFYTIKCLLPKHLKGSGCCNEQTCSSTCSNIYQENIINQPYNWTPMLIKCYQLLLSG